MSPVGIEAWEISWSSQVPFEPGQVVPVTVAPDIPPRLYSLSSATSGPDRSLLFNLVPQGVLTNRLSGLVPGDNLYVGDPTGSFRTPAGPAVWIANGTGVAPFLSMIRSGQASGATLVHGARTKRQFYGQEEFEAALGERYVRCASSDSGPGLYSGRLTAYIERHEWNPHVPYLLCGSAAMIVETRDLLIRAGVPFAKILSEVYF